MTTPSFVARRRFALVLIAVAFLIQPDIRAQTVSELGNVARSQLTGEGIPRALIFTKMAGYRHLTLPECERNLKALLETNQIAVDETDDSRCFTDLGLKPYKALVFLDTSGDLFTPAQRDALVAYIRAGGGFVGIHGASTAEKKWPWYGELLGARFGGHPWVQTATVTVLDPAHPADKGLPARWTRNDEWYSFEGPLMNVTPLLQVGETFWHGDGVVEKGTRAGKIPPVGSPEAVVQPHVIAWCHEFEGGRSFYTAMGHFGSAFLEPEMQAHLLAGIRWAARLDSPVSASHL